MPSLGFDGTRAKKNDPTAPQPLAVNGANGQRQQDGLCSFEPVKKVSKTQAKQSVFLVE